MKISVALCTYNGEQFIEQQLDSILAQTIIPDEIVVCDDASKDSTISILLNYQEKYPFIKIHQNLINLRSNRNFDQAISLCTGDYIFLSDQDDIWKKNKVETILKKFESNPKLEVVFSNGDLINNQNEVFTKTSLWESFGFCEEKLEKPIDLFQLLKYKTNMVTGATLCFKSELKKHIIPIPFSEKHGNYYYHDDWISLISASRYSLDYVTEKLISYRIHNAQQVGTKIKNNSSNTLFELTSNVLQNSLPNSYSKCKRLSNIFYKNYLKFHYLSEEYDKNLIDFKLISNKNLDYFEKSESHLKKLNFIFYFSRKFIDKIKGKRQISLK